MRSAEHALESGSGEEGGGGVRDCGGNWKR